jgi:hypothetical protein
MMVKILVALPAWGGVKSLSHTGPWDFARSANLELFGNIDIIIRIYASNIEISGT